MRGGGFGLLSALEFLGRQDLGIGQVQPQRFQRVDIAHPALWWPWMAPLERNPRLAR